MELALTVAGGLVVAALSGIGGFVVRWWLHRRRPASPRAGGAAPLANHGLPTASTGIPFALAALPRPPDADDTVVHNLGPRPDLLGRDQQVVSILEAVGGQRQPIAIFGPAGIGKSSVALEVAYRAAHSDATWSEPSGHFRYVLFFSGRLKPLELAPLVDELARWTGNVYIMQLPDLDAKLVETRKILSRERSLLILDNLETVVDSGIYGLAEMVPYPSRLVTTSRRHHPELRSARHIELPAISAAPSEQLLVREIAEVPGAPRGTATLRESSPRVFERLRLLTRGNPLAIRWAAGQLRVMSGESLVASLEAGRADLFKMMFERTWSKLTGRARRVILALTRLPSPPTVAAVLSVADAGSADDPDGVMVELASPRLVELIDESHQREPRVTLHPLTHAFATNKLAKLPSTVRESIDDAVVACYQASIAEYGGRDWDDPEPFDRIDLDRDNYLRAARTAYDHGDWPSVMAIVDGLRNYLLIHGYWTKRLELCRLASEAADAAGQTRNRGRFQRHIGWTLVLQGDLGQAEHHLTQARAIAITERDTKGEADATGDLAEVARLRGDLGQSRELRNESIRLSRLGGQGRDIYVEETMLAQLDLQEGNLEAARAGLTSSMRLAEGLRWHRAIAYCLHWLGEVARLQGDHALARSYLAQSRSYLERFHDRARLVLIQKSEALLADAEGDAVLARALAEEAIVELRRIGLPYEARELDQLLAVGTED